MLTLVLVLPFHFFDGNKRIDDITLTIRRAIATVIFISVRITIDNTNEKNNSER